MLEITTQIPLISDTTRFSAQIPKFSYRRYTFQQRNAFDREKSESNFQFQDPIVGTKGTVTAKP